MKMTRRLSGSVLVLGLGAMVAFNHASMAQPGANDGGPGGGPGGRAGGERPGGERAGGGWNRGGEGGPRGGGPGRAAVLPTVEDMTRALELTPEQQQKIRAILDATRQQIDETLTPEQRERMRQMSVVRQPGGGMSLEEMTRQLDLTVDQQRQILAINNKRDEELAKLRDDTALSPEQRRAEMQRINSNTRLQINRLLTPEQREKMQALRPQGQGGGRGAGGGQRGQRRGGDGGGAAQMD